MFRHIAVSLAVILSSVSPLLVSIEASAETALTRAVIESLRNQVRLMRQNQSARPARPSDTMTPGDALATASASTAQLRFNDGSLARLGQQVVFKFVPGSRSFRLSNGTALLLIPPGQGRTNVRTPNAAAGIRGSALFVRYNPETDTTIVGALTNSGIEVFNQTASQTQELKAGYMAVIVKDRIQQVYEFDLNNFYRTSELVRGLNLTKTEATPSPDEAIASVQAETAQALKEQSQFTSEQVIENPSFVKLPASTSENFPDLAPNANDGTPSSRGQTSGSFQDEDIRLLRQRQDIVDTPSSPRTDSDNRSNSNNGNNSNNGSNPDNSTNPINNRNNSNNRSNRDNQRNPNNRNTTNNGNNQNNQTNTTDRNNSNNPSNRDNQRNPNNRNTTNNGNNRNNPTNTTDSNSTNNGSAGNNQNNPTNTTDRNNTNNRSNRDNQRNPNNRNTTNNGNNNRDN